MSNKIISTSSEWTFELIEKYEREIARVAADYRLDTYPNQLEVISAEQMMDAYSSVGMPVGYHHWSFGKRFVGTEQNYRHGMMGLAYEIVINSNPCIAYLMEENTLTMQALVIAHAAKIITIHWPVVICRSLRSTPRLTIGPIGYCGL